MATSQGIKLDDKTKARLKTLAEKRQRTPHWLMRQAIETYLETEEAYEKEKAEDMERWERYVATGNAVDHAAADAWLTDLAQHKVRPWPQ